jgi:hypothetical protein
MFLQELKETDKTRLLKSYALNRGLEDRYETFLEFLYNLHGSEIKLERCPLCNQLMINDDGEHVEFCPEVGV